MSDGFDPEYFPKLAALEEKNFWFAARNQLILWAFDKYFPRASNFLEIGCGTGYVLSAIETHFPDLRLYGSEIFETGLQYARKRVRRAELLQMDAKNIPFRDEFDVIGAFDVLEHVSDDASVLSQMFRAARSGGGILLTVPQHPFLWSRFDEFSHHVRRYTSAELASKVERAGFRVAGVRSFMSLVFPALLWARYKRSGATNTYDGFSELRVGAVMNTLAEKILALEKFFIAAGVSFPFGGSLLLAARKD